MANTVVLIDDDQDDLDLMKEAIALVDADLNCISYTYPQEAMRVLLSNTGEHPGYIFIDINMPGLSGDKCLKALRSENKFDRVVISLYSTSMPQAVTEALKSAGATYTFEKPVRMSAYIDILKKIMSSDDRDGD